MNLSKITLSMPNSSGCHFSLLAALACSAFALRPCEAALILEYPLNQSSGTTANETSGFGTPANGTLNGGATWVNSSPSGTGNSLSLDGVNGTNVDAGTVSKTASLDAFTLTMWVDLTADPANLDRLFSTLSSGTLLGIDFYIANPTIGTLSASNFTLGLGVNGNVAPAVANAGAGMSANNTWAFVAVSYDGTTVSNNTTFYSGGVLTSSSQLGTVKSISSGSVSATPGPLMIGDTAASGSDRTPSAYISGLRLYDEVLSSVQIESIRVATVPEPSTVAMLGVGVGLVLLRARSRSRRMEA